MDCGGKAQRRHRFRFTLDTVSPPKAPSPLRSAGALQNLADGDVILLPTRRGRPGARRPGRKSRRRRRRTKRRSSSHERACVLDCGGRVQSKTWRTHPRPRLTQSVLDSGGDRYGFSFKLAADKLSRKSKFTSIRKWVERATCPFGAATCRAAGVAGAGIFYTDRFESGAFPFARLVAGRNGLVARSTHLDFGFRVYLPCLGVIRPNLSLAAVHASASAGSNS